MEPSSASADISEFAKSKQAAGSKYKDKTEAFVGTEDDRQDPPSLPADTERDYDYDMYDTRKCNTTTTSTKDNPSESVESRHWSIMRSSSEDFPQASSLPSDQNVQAVRIKDEPLSPRDEYCHSSHLQEHSIPDDLKTPLELLASCERSSSADGRGQVNVGVNQRASDSSRYQIANVSELREPLVDVSDRSVSQSKSYAPPPSWHQQQLGNRDIGGGKAAPSFAMMSRSLDSKESSSAGSGFSHRQHPTAATKYSDKMHQEVERARQCVDQGRDGRNYFHTTEAQHMAHSERMPSGGE